MAIRPIEFTGMIQNTTEISHTKAVEQHRPQEEQEQAAMYNAHRSAVSTSQVSDTKETAKDKFDPSHGGDGTGYRKEGDKKKKDKGKKKGGPDGEVKLRDKRITFDTSV